MTAVLLFAFGWLLIRTGRSVVIRMVRCPLKGRVCLGDLICSAITALAWIVLSMIVLSRLGVDVMPLVASLGIGGFVVGFAMREMLANLAAGFMLSLGKPFEIGDYVRVSDLEGTVMGVDMMAVSLATTDNRKIVIPNSSAWNVPVLNFTALGQRRVDMEFGVGLDADIPTALLVAKEAVREVPGVLTEPEPSVSVSVIEDGEAVINVRPWAAASDYWNVYSAACLIVTSALEERGFDAPFAQIGVKMSGKGRKR